MKVVHWKDVEAKDVEGLEGVTIRWLITQEDGAPYFAMRLFEVQPGCNSPHHQHWWEHEIFILDGTGIVEIDGQEHPIGPGTAILIPGGSLHRLVNTGDAVLRFLCLIPHPYLEGVKP